MPSRISSFLSSRRLPFVAAILSILLLLPTLWQGLKVDDYHHRAAILGLESGGYSLKGDFVNLYSFLDGNPQNNNALVETGHAPWWTDPEAKISFFRPLSALTQLLDYKLWPNSPFKMYAHNLVWMFALVIIAGLFYRKLFGRNMAIAAGLALLLFAVDEAHAETVGWIAQRNALIAVFLGVLALIAHHRHKAEQWKPGIYLAPALFTLALLAGEAGINTLAYLISYALFLDTGKWGKRTRSILPFLIITVIWRLGVTAAGFGVANVDYYIDPSQQPLQFLSEAVIRLPILLAGLLTPVSASFALYGPPETSDKLFILGCTITVLIGAIFWPLLRRDKTAGFFALAALLSLIPNCAVGPSNRMLLWSSLGAMGFLAYAIVTSFNRDMTMHPSSRPVRLIWSIFAVVLILVHLVIAPILKPLTITSIKEIVPQLYVSLPDDPAISNQSIIVVNGPLAFASSHLQVMQAAENLPIPRHVRILSSSFASVELNRLDEYTLILNPDGGYIAHRLDALACSRNHPLPIGYQVELSDLTVEVLSQTPDGRPGSIACRFKTPLEHDSLRWYFWQNGRYKPWTLPQVGQSVNLPPAILL